MPVTSALLTQKRMNSNQSGRLRSPQPSTSEVNMTDNFNIESSVDILDACLHINKVLKDSDSLKTTYSSILLSKVVIAYVKGEVFEEAQVTEDPELKTEQSKKLGVSLMTLSRAETLLRSGWKSKIQIANHLSITTDTVKTKVLPNLRRRHNVERERFGATGKYKYRIASLTAYK
jgi:DNA-binding CsgD family transcriptional regulator